MEEPHLDPQTQSSVPRFGNVSRDSAKSGAKKKLELKWGEDILLILIEVMLE